MHFATLQKGFAPVIILIGALLLISISGASYYFIALRNKELPKKQQTSDLDNQVQQMSVPGQSDEFDSQRKDDLEYIRVMLKIYLSDNSQYPSGLEELTGLYPWMSTKDPETDEPYEYKPSLDFKSYALKANLSNATVYEGDPQNLEKATALVINENIKALAHRLESYYSDNNVYPTQLDELVPKYTKKIPQNPHTLKEYQYQSSGDKYTISGELPNGEIYKYPGT